MKRRIMLVAVLAIVLAFTGCAWMLPDAAPLVVYRRQGGKNSSLFISVWQLTVDVNGKITAVANPGNLLQTAQRVDVASSDFMAELRDTLDSEEMQTLDPEQLLDTSRKIKTPEYTYTIIYGGRVLQTVSGAVPPGMMPALRILDQKLQLMDSPATAPGVDQFGLVPTVTVTPPRPSPSPVAPTRTRVASTATPKR